MRFTALLFMLFQALTGQAQSSGDSFTEFQLATYSLQYKEKVYLHLDKAYYNAGEDLWFKAYLVNAGTHIQGDLDNVLYVDIIDPKGTVIDTRIIKIEKGAGYGDFRLPKNMPGGAYTVRAYTNYMRNFDASYFFRKQIYINSVSRSGPENTVSGQSPGPAETSEVIFGMQRPDLQFFPEGGQMVNGYFNRIGFKVLGADGKGVDVSGRILDEKGAEVTEFATSKFGMGMVDLMPGKGKKYTAAIDYMGTSYSYDLPQGRNSGTLFRVQELKDLYQVSVLTTRPYGINGFRLIGAQRNGILYDAKIKGEGNKVVIKVKKDLLGTGIVRFTLLDQHDIAICERLVFYDGGVSTNLETAPSFHNYSKGGMVELNMALTLGPDEALESTADLSISVTDLAVAQPLEEQPDIITYLLLYSELKGEIESPGYYFYSKDPQRREHLDLLMMSQGWRQFILGDTGRTNGEDLEFFSETGITIEGNVLDRPKGKKVVGAHVSMSYWDEGGLGKDKVITDGNGHFKFLGLDFLDKSGLIIEARDFKRSKSGLFVELDSMFRPPVMTRNILAGQVDGEGNRRYMAVPSDQLRINTAFAHEDGLVELDEVVVKSRLRELSDNRTAANSLYRTANNTLDLSDIRDQSYSTLVDAIRSKVPGVSVIADTIIIRGRGSFSRDPLPLFLLDGVPVDYGVIKYLSTWEVDFVDILKGAKAAVYGSRGTNGVIAVYTATGNKGSITKLVKNPDSYVHEGFYPARKFYEPVFEDFARDPKNGYSSTLYWEPTVRLEATGKAKINFPAGTRSGIFKAVLQGLTADGIPISSEAIFEVK
tara:strand:+ start:2311 stop:4767 length:2457 start_codon:yes stop_codon:yes gene_type:complete